MCMCVDVTVSVCAPVVCGYECVCVYVERYAPVCPCVFVSVCVLDCVCAHVCPIVTPVGIGVRCDFQRENASLGWVNKVEEDVLTKHGLLAWAQVQVLLLKRDARRLALCPRGR
jgi:hypothetical protein